jgi:hypothetical protein
MKSLILLAAIFSGPVHASTDHPAVSGCLEVLTAEFEDGASYYQSVGAKIVSPLLQNEKSTVLGKFLESALITSGNQTVTAALCENIRAALR